MRSTSSLISFLQHLVFFHPFPPLIWQPSSHFPRRPHFPLSFFPSAPFSFSHCTFDPFFLRLLTRYFLLQFLFLVHEDSHARLGCVILLSVYKSAVFLFPSTNLLLFLSTNLLFFLSTNLLFFLSTNLVFFLSLYKFAFLSFSLQNSCSFFFLQVCCSCCL